MDGFIQISYCFLLETRLADYILSFKIRLYSKLPPLSMSYTPTSAKMMHRNAPRKQAALALGGGEKALHIQGSCSQILICKQLSLTLDGKFLPPVASIPYIKSIHADYLTCLDKIRH